LIEFENVAKAYRNPRASKIILRGFSGEFPIGRNVGLLGANGAGKSTLLKMIAGSEFPDTGRIRRRVRVSFPVGILGFKGTLTGRENCRFVSRIYGMNPRSVERFVEEFAELGKYFEMPISTYSSGMKARLTFGLTMAIDFDCYLLDEAFSVGDGLFKARADALWEARTKDANLIVVSHASGTIRRYCDFGAVLSRGELTLYDDLEDAISHYEAITRDLGTFE
jgi:capsular polysaccharide transport system ATP-binding protein